MSTPNKENKDSKEKADQPVEEKKQSQKQEEEVEFDGNYTDSGESTEEQENEDEESEKISDKESINDNKKKSTKKHTKKPSKQSSKKKNRLIMNVSDCRYPVVKFVGKKIFQWKLQYDPEAMDWDLFWTDNAVQPEQLGRMQPHQKINHFPGMFSLARKNHLGRNLMKMKRQFPDQYKYFPRTWLLPAEYTDFRMQFEKKQKGKVRTYIVKPEASCQGRGIFLTRSLEDLNSTDHYVVQRYLCKPFLIDQLKFDFRIYILLAGCDPLRIYMYNEGLTRFATETYEQPNKDNMTNMCMHLTNYAINKDNPNFLFNEDEKVMDVGHKRSLTSVLNLLKRDGHDVDGMLKEIKRMFIKTFCSVQPILGHHYKSCQPDNYANNMCFEVLGMDVIIDHKLKPYLLEVNHTPSFTTDTPLDSLIKKNVIRDAIILMNHNHKSKTEIINQRKELMQKRVLTGKKVKLTPEEKMEEFKKSQDKRDQWEQSHMGGYERIFPVDNEEESKEYQEYLNYALKIYEDWTGANIRRNTKKIVETPKQILLNQSQQQQKKLNRPQDLEKIYNQKMAKLNTNNNMKKIPSKPPSQPVQKNPNEDPLICDPQQQQQMLDPQMQISPQDMLVGEDGQLRDSQQVLPEDYQFQEQQEYQDQLDQQQYTMGKNNNINQMQQFENGSPEGIPRNGSGKIVDFRIKKAGQLSPYNMQVQQKKMQFQIKKGDVNTLRPDEIVREEDKYDEKIQSQQAFVRYAQQQQMQQENYEQILTDHNTVNQAILIQELKNGKYKMNSNWNQNKQRLENEEIEKKFMYQGQFPGIKDPQMQYYLQQQKQEVHKGQPKKAMPSQLQNGGGLFITPKLFDLNILSKAQEEENYKKEQQLQQNQRGGYKSNNQGSIGGTNYGNAHQGDYNVQKQMNIYYKK